MTATNHSIIARIKHPYVGRLLRSLSAITGAAALLTLILIAAQVVAQGTVIDPAAGEETMRVIGALENGGLGYAATSGDVNGDGYDDLLVSAPFATVVSGTEVYTGSGAVYLILGRPNISTTWDLTSTPPNITFYGNCFPDSDPGANCPEWVGSDVAVGDFNGDGLDDIIIGTERYGGAPGAAFVFVGRSNLTITDRLTVNIKSKATATELGYNLKVVGAWTYDRLGNSVAMGDVNGDGYDDLIMGAHHAWVDAVTNTTIWDPPDYQRYHYAAPVSRQWAGAMYVSLGESSRISKSNRYQDLFICLQSYTVYGDDDFDFFGRSVASGDINDDGYADIIVGAVGGDGDDNRTPITDSGEVHVFWGSDVITYPIPSACPADVYTSHIIIDLAYTSTVHTDGITIGHTADVTIYGASAHDWAGRDVSSADLNDDGYDDIIIGAPGDTDDYPDHYGKVYVLYGEITPAHTIYLSETVDLIIVGEEAGDRLGESVSAADLNGDGYDDLIVSAIHADYNATTETGKTYVFYGTGGDGLVGTIYLSETNTADITFVGEENYDNLGKGLGAGDMNHNGILDLLVGAPSLKFDAWHHLIGSNDEGILYTLAGDVVRGITLTGELTTVAAGLPATYTMVAWNLYADWDATTASTFTLESGAGGNCVENVCSPTKVGTWSVSGEYGAFTDTMPLTVTPAALHHVLVSPALAVLEPGEKQQFTAQGYDSYNNAIEGLTYNWSVENGGGTINNSGLFTAALATGTYTDTVLVSADGSTDTATVVVGNLTPTAIIAGTPLSGDEGAPVTFDGSPSYDIESDIVSYAWDWDYNGTTFITDELGISTNHTWGDDGTFAVALQVIDDNGASHITSTLVTVANVAPDVELGGPHTTPLTQTITITPTVSDPGEDTFTYAWDLDDDGDFDDASTPTAVFSPTAAGLFTVSLRAEDDDGGIGSDHAQIVVGNLAPVAIIVGTPITGAPGMPVLFDGSLSYDVGGSIVAYAWDWDYNGSFFTDTLALSTTHQWDSPGTYTVALRVTDDQGASGLTTTPVAICNSKLFLPLVLRNS
jgi:hypothetical protein